MKYFFSIITVVLFAVGFAASGEESELEKLKNEAKMRRLVGTYVIVDEDNVTYTININDDWTVVAKGHGQEYYGSWSESGGNVRFEFSGEYDELPGIMFKAGNLRIDNDYEITEDGFIYGKVWGAGDPLHRNPEYRLKYSKTN